MDSSTIVLLVATHTMVKADVPSILPAIHSSVQFCRGALGSDGQSATAGMNYRAHSLIAVDLLTANATSTAAMIDGLLRRERERPATTIPWHATCCCKGDINDKSDKEAMSSLEASASAAVECQDDFTKSNSTSPVTAENDDAFMLAKLSVALVGGAHGLPSSLGSSVVPYKSGERQKLVDAGYLIWSDLLGTPEAYRTFKVPDPMYYGWSEGPELRPSHGSGR
ncbi:hypothetical protein HU200_020669 [Digitaria exilis]|uniref:Uncharacterized protein n=1 Tax=Digitaria exilis TaxID=1010633 RepID=A0A835F106_9POAL|nr:hypothetical protein HU200_020669 [Digitaria exilis]